MYIKGVYLLALRYRLLMGEVVENTSVCIVVICKNNAVGLDRTLKSITVQNFSSWTCLIVLGKSIDASYSVAKTFMHKDARITVMHQVGSGIYEAMNQGVESAPLFAHYFSFMNSGDVFAEAVSLTTILEKAQSLNSDVIIGGYGVQNSNQNYRNSAGLLSPMRLTFGLRNSCHQSMLFKSKIFRDLGMKYDPAFKLCADHELIMRCIKQGLRILTFPEIISRVESGGVSDSNLKEVHQEKHIIRMREYEGNPFMNLFGKLFQFLLATKRFSRRMSH